ncbi:MAG: glycosyltransferase family 4 protein, partial [Treponema sp.]|nr:glycosyltransferase family 4 protein [Treponema sp.]
TGKLEFEDLIKRVAAADIFCFPTKYPEGLPTCMLEAMAAGLYSITSSCGGAKEVIADDSYGRIMDSCDEKAVMNELRTTLLMDGGERRKIAENGRRRVKEFFTWDNTVREMERIFEEICR